MSERTGSVRTSGATSHGAGREGRNPNYRINREERYGKSMEYLTQDAKLFPSYAVLLIYSALVGYENDAFLPVERPLPGMGIHLTNFDSIPGGRELLDLLAFARMRSQEALATDESYKAFEGYANAGYPLLLQKLGIAEGEVLDDQRVVELTKHLYALSVPGGGGLSVS